MTKFEEWWDNQRVKGVDRRTSLEAWNAAIEAASDKAQHDQPCDCDVAYTSRNRHAPDCFWQNNQEVAEQILELKEPT